MLRMLLLCVAGFGLCLGQVLKPGACPEFIPKTDFEVPPYLGKWLEIARFATKDQEGQTCNYAEYSDNGDGTVGVHNAGLEENGTYTEIFGYVETTDVPGALALHLDGVPVVGSYNVLETDYVAYTSVYSCITVIGGFHADQAWVLARHLLTDQELEVALSAFSRWGIEVDRFIFTPQNDCSGLP
ncbi:apolipoprotein D-like [Eriocheir sinensis]|uniref:Crustacyanin-A2 n=1 Tax=Eriocheir sinensis TaxID=95602 RepID=A0A509GJF3_ERISI|nr:apolipoprotein D-like [Eriocheir sinensis]AYU71111.1 crustacyanin-A2 [Eriocheir sinensis]